MKMFIATGYNSYTNKQLSKAFSNEAEADQFLIGLTDPRLNVIKYRSTAELLNYFLSKA